MATTCSKCNSTDVSKEQYYLDSVTREKTVLPSVKKDSSIIAFFSVLLGLGLLSLGLFTLPLLFADDWKYFGTIALGLIGGISFTWNGVNTIRKNILLSKQKLVTEYLCKSCSHVWQEQNIIAKKPVYLTLLPIGAGFFSCILMAIFSMQLNSNMTMIMFIAGIVVSSIVFYVTKQWIQKISN